MAIYFTLTGCNHYFGNEFLKEGQRVTLVKEPDNKVDTEAIMVKLEGLGKIGYVANSTYTVKGESYSAGRIYDKIGDTATAKVKLIIPGGAICKLSKKSLLGCDGKKLMSVSSKKNSVLKELFDDIEFDCDEDE